MKTENGKQKKEIGKLPQATRSVRGAVVRIGISQRGEKSSEFEM
jgi:hypothetical protein